MGYALLWLESLGTVVVFVAVITALIGRIRGSRTRTLVRMFFGALMILLAGLVTVLNGWVHFDTPIFLTIVFFWYVVLWSSVFILTTVLLLTLGLRKGVDDRPRARGWSLRRLFLALFGLFVLTWITFANLDTAATMRLATVRALKCSV